MLSVAWGGSRTGAGSRRASILGLRALLNAAGVRFDICYRALLRRLRMPVVGVWRIGCSWPVADRLFSGRAMSKADGWSSHSHCPLSAQSRKSNGGSEVLNFMMQPGDGIGNDLL